MDERARARGDRRDDGFWWTNHVANPVLRRLLRGPLGARLGRRLAVIRYRGRRTGRPRELVVQYARDGGRVWVMPGRPESKRWWRNLVDRAPVELWLAGDDVRGIAVAVTDREASFDDGVEAYLATFPRARDAGWPTVMVCVDLAPAAAETTRGSRARLLEGEASP